MPQRRRRRVGQIRVLERSEAAKRPWLNTRNLEPQDYFLSRDHVHAAQLIRNGRTKFVECEETEGTTAGFDIGAGRRMVNNYMRRVRFSPNGALLATDSSDNVIRVYESKKLKESWASPYTAPENKIPIANYVQDFCWHPNMSMFVVSTRKAPPRIIWSNGTFATSIAAKNAVDEHRTITCLEWLDGNRFAGGCDKGTLIFFDLNADDKAADQVETNKDSFGNLPHGRISCLAKSHDGASIAVGNYQGTVAIYVNEHSRFVHYFRCADQAVVDLRFSADDTKVFVAYRNTDAIYCWDMRSLREEYAELRRPYKTLKRIEFDMDRSGHWLVSGSVCDEAGGEFYFFDLNDLDAPPIRHPVLSSTAVSTLSVHPKAPVVASGTGERIFPRQPKIFGLSDSEDEDRLLPTLTSRQRYLYNRDVNEQKVLDNYLLLHDFTELRQ